MTSEKQLEANQKNSIKSTGPRSAKGKKKASQNSLQHGLLSDGVVIKGEENIKLYETLWEGLYADFQPVGMFECLLVERIVSGYWRLRRLAEMEAGILQYGMYAEFVTRAERKAKSYELSELEIMIEDHRAKGVFDKKAHEQALREARNGKELQADDDATLMGRAFTQDEAAWGITNLWRYEAAIERSLYRAKRELQEHQANRNGDGFVSSKEVIGD